MATAKLKPVEAIVRLIRNNCAHNTAVALAYVSEPQAFAGLTDAQRKQIHNGACALLGLEITATHAELIATAAQFELAGRQPRFSWVHQNYSPYAEPGKARRPALSKQYALAVTAGMIAPPAEFVEVCKAATFAKDANPQGVILAAPRRGGYILAVKLDAEASKAERPGKGKKAPATPQEIATWL